MLNQRVVLKPQNPKASNWTQWNISEHCFQ